MHDVKSFDPVWEDRYRDNPSYRNHYPWSSVVSFVLSNYPAAGDRKLVNLLEVGCGNGANLWFAAREGFRVSGIDASETAIAYARQWFAREGLSGDLQVGDFTRLPFKEDQFHLVIDRAALSFSSIPGIRQALKEIWRVLRPGGKLFFNPYSDRCSSFDGPADADGCFRHVARGTITPGAQICFLGRERIDDLFSEGWRIESMVHDEQVYAHTTDQIVHAEWHIVAVKPLVAHE